MGKSDLKQKNERLTRLLGLLRSADHWTTNQLATELDVSIRTLMRDLNELKDLGYPLEADRGRGGGVRLYGRWGIDKINFTNQEAISLLLSLSIMETLSHQQDDLGVRALKQKIANAFPEQQRKSINELRKRILIGAPASTPVLSQFSKSSSEIWKDAITYFLEAKRVRIHYRDEKGQSTIREFDPQFLILNWPVWYFLGWDYLRNDVRFFRIDRIKKIESISALITRRARSLFLDAYESYFKNL